MQACSRSWYRTRRFFNVGLRRLRSVLTQRSANSERVQQTMAAMMAGFPADDAQKLRRILAKYAQASDDQVCWSERTMRQGISGLGKSDQVNWALSIVE